MNFIRKALSEKDLNLRPRSHDDPSNFLNVRYLLPILQSAKLRRMRVRWSTLLQKWEHHDIFERP